VSPKAGMRLSGELRELDVPPCPSGSLPAPTLAVRGKRKRDLRVAGLALVVQTRHAAGVPRGACLVSEATELENGAPLAVGFTHLAGLCFARELIAAGARSPCVELLWRA
jgi:hypothetical protein